MDDLFKRMVSDTESVGQGNNSIERPAGLEEEVVANLGKN
jgi:hypothetical protein